MRTRPFVPARHATPLLGLALTVLLPLVGCGTTSPTDVVIDDDGEQQPLTPPEAGTPAPDGQPPAPDGQPQQSGDTGDTDGNVEPAEPAEPAEGDELKVTLTVSGPGVITSTPAGIECGGGATACAATFAGPVTLATDQATTVRWSGDCAGNADCVVDASGARTIEATTFAPIVRTFDRDDHRDDRCHAIAARAGGGAIITGEVQNLAVGRNAWTRAYDATGNVLWTRELSLGGEGSDSGYDVLGLPDGSSIVAGRWYSGSNTRFNYFVAEFLANGTEGFNTQSSLIGDEHYLSIALDPSGALIAGGVLGTQGWIRKTDRTGRTQSWSVVRGTSVDKVLAASDGTILAVGSDGSAVPWISRYSSESVVLWSNALPGVNDVALTADGGFVAVGRTTTAWLRAYNADGTEKWTTDIVGGAAGSVAVDGNGNIAVGGGAGARSYDRDGVLRWQRALSSGGVSDVAVDENGSVLVCGTVTATAGNPDILFAIFPQ